MFCPKCRAEYRPEFTRCADCKVPLVHTLEQKHTPERIEFKEVFSTFNNSDIVTLKSILNEKNIEHHFIGEFFNAARPFLQPARLMVEKTRFDEVREIIKGLELQVNSVSLTSNYNEEEIVATPKRALIFFCALGLVLIGITIALVFTAK